MSAAGPCSGVELVTDWSSSEVGVAEVGMAEVGASRVGISPSSRTQSSMKVGGGVWGGAAIIFSSTLMTGEISTKSSLGSGVEDNDSLRSGTVDESVVVVLLFLLLLSSRSKGWFSS